MYEVCRRGILTVHLIIVYYDPVKIYRSLYVSSIKVIKIIYLIILYGLITLLDILLRLDNKQMSV
ncbi:hypothetical protein GFV14_00474 [Candidatus Hartigia pinicola]|nr:hypothetical protein GFV14_00474 [Candidatus Hartigia pinicola]